MNELDWKKFIGFWSQFYTAGTNPDDKFYYPFISDEGLSKVSALDELWLWKMGKYYFTVFWKQLESIKQNKENILKFRALDPGFEILHAFSKKFFPGGLIYQIFLMHICRPEEYPIFDQHVFRAFTFITKKEIVDKPKNIQDYLGYKQYIFEIRKESGISLREIDKGLMAFGQFLAKPEKFLKI
jgi:hypothetical protein